MLFFIVLGPGRPRWSTTNVTLIKLNKVMLFNFAQVLSYIKIHNINLVKFA